MREIEFRGQEIGTCRGIMYHVPKLAEQPLCSKVKNKLKELEKQE